MSLSPTRSPATATATALRRRGLLLGVLKDQTDQVEYRWRTLAGEFGDDGAAPPQLNPDQYAPLVGGASPIVHVQARAVDAPVEVQIEETHR